MFFSAHHRIVSILNEMCIESGHPIKSVGLKLLIIRAFICGILFIQVK